MGTHDLLQISLAGREAVLQRGAGKTPHALGKNYKEPAVFSKVRMWAKGPSAEALGDTAGAIFSFFRERESWSKGLRRWRTGRAEGERENILSCFCAQSKARHGT